MKTRAIWWMVAVSVGFLGAGTCLAEVNLLLNGGFEEGVLAPWVQYGSMTTEVVQTLDGAAVPEEPIEGKSCLHIVVTAKGGNYWDSWIKQPGLVFENSARYTFAAYFKAKSGTVQVNFKPEVDGNPYTGYGSQAFTMTDQWQEFHVTTPFLTERVTPADVCFHVAYDVGDFWVDGVRFYLGEYVEPGFLTSALATKPSPDKGAGDVPRDRSLSWRPGMFAKTHTVYLGTSFDDVNNASLSNPLGVLVSQGQDSNSYDPVGLFDYGQTYTWRIDEVNAAPDATVYKGNVWSFTVETYGYVVKPVKATASTSMASTMGPEKTIDGSGLDGEDHHGTSASQMWLSKKGQSPIWIQYEFDKAYKLYQMWVWNSNQQVETITGFGAKDVTVQTSVDGATWTALAGSPQFSQAPGDANYVHNTTVDFAGAEAKYVKLSISANWADGTKQAGLSEVRFFYTPVKAFGPAPASGATDVGLDATLNWRPGRLAAQHQVYLGTDPGALALAQTVTAHSLPLGPLGLEFGRTYTWRVDEVNDAASPAVWQGDAWSFTTIGYAVVDDFESYDDLCNRIFFGWVDGFGYSASPDCGVVFSSGNGTGSTVGNVQPPFAEQAVIHSGKQSMPMGFDNTRSPYYSEAQREWATAQSWTGGGANALVVYLRGDAPGFLETTAGTILMNGTGSDIWDSTDQFRFAYKQLKGNGSIVTRVDSVANTDGWAKAGVMIREDFQTGSANALVAVTPANGISFQWRPTRDAASSNVAVAGLAAPYWVKVTRTGDTLTAQYSANGIAWMDLVATPSVTIPMASDVYIGLAVCSHVTSSACGAKFSSVSTTGNVSGSWQTTGIGASQTGGNTPETFYVRLQDSAGTAKVAANADPSVIATGAWQEWSIPFSQFTSAGINMGSIKKMAVGVGDPASPKAGGSGKLYIDDIRLTRVAAP